MDNATPCTPAADYRTDATRVDGWTPQRQALFLQTLAHSGLVSEACREVGMSPTSAYIFRRRAEGLGFALGWKAAILLTRDKLADMLVEGALTGVDAVTTRDEGVTRRRAINYGLSRGVLNWLERQAFELDNPEAATSRAIASAFGDFVELIAAGCSREDVAAFLERHPDPLAVANARQEARDHAGPSAQVGAAAGPSAEAAQVAQARKLVEKSAIYFGDPDVPEVPGISARNLRRLQRAKKRLLGAR